MKLSEKIFTLLLAAACLCASGCNSFPKDSYGKKVKGIVNTPWGPSEWSADELATGKAAIEAAKDAPPKPARVNP